MEDRQTNPTVPSRLTTLRPTLTTLLVYFRLARRFNCGGGTLSTSFGRLGSTCVSPAAAAPRTFACQMETLVSLPNKEFLSSSAVLLGRYLEEVAPEIRPAALERQVLGETGGVKICGYIDIVVDGNLIDVKTAARRPSGIDSGCRWH